MRACVQVWFVCVCVCVCVCVVCVCARVGCAYVWRVCVNCIQVLCVVLIVVFACFVHACIFVHSVYSYTYFACVPCVLHV